MDHEAQEVYEFPNPQFIQDVAEAFPEKMIANAEEARVRGSSGSSGSSSGGGSCAGAARAPPSRAPTRRLQPPTPPPPCPLPSPPQTLVHLGYTYIDVRPELEVDEVGKWKGAVNVPFVNSKRVYSPEENKKVRRAGWLGRLGRALGLGA
jgi:hypothetical protein